MNEEHVWLISIILSSLHKLWVLRHDKVKESQTTTLYVMSSFVFMFKFTSGVACCVLCGNG